MEKKSAVWFILIAIIVFGVIYATINLTQNVGKTTSTVNMESSAKKLNTLYQNINVKTLNVQRGAVNSDEEKIAVLPDISEYPFVVKPTTDSFITIYASLDKANESEDSWLVQIGNAFNQSNPTINGVPVSVGIRAIPSNLGAEFILSEKYTPDAYMPSSKMYGAMLDTKEKKYSIASESIVKNVSGIVISRSVKNKINQEAGKSDFDAIINSVITSNTLIGYTNPLSNEDGLNFLVALLQTFDGNYLLSDSAMSKLRAYQDKIPYVSYDVLQLQESLKNGTIDGFASNYQAYYTNPSLRNNYDFVPFGYRQDAPVYAIGELSSSKSDILNKFVEYCLNNDNQTKATNMGFNAHQDYAYNVAELDGITVMDAQSAWKKEKNGTSDLTAVFVADISGSMEGSPLLKLKASLNRAATFIDENTNIGLVTFSDTVNIALPIAKFDSAQKSYFSNAVKSMRPGGGTAMFDAIVVAEHLLLEQQSKNPNTRLMMFVLTDGESNRGYGLEDIEEITRGLKIPVYTIGYNLEDEGIEALEAVADINEASTMDADSDNVIYKLESLFNAQM
ncbi:MAG: VWA domain-containing protein [Clostridia bacterium]|nr:VWA domain-containing protein [Clostridia bacterium]